MAKRKRTKGQRSTKHTHKTKDRVTRTPLITGGELRDVVSPREVPTMERKLKIKRYFILYN